MPSSTCVKRFTGLLMGGMLAVLSMTALGDSAVTKGSKAAGMDACVAPSADMRRNHMDYLKHDRVETVRKGNRNTKYSLTECIDCHAEKRADGGFEPVDAPEQFCGSCHDYMAVSPACFQCHRTTPSEAGAADSAMGESGTGIHALGLLDHPLHLRAVGEGLVQLQTAGGGN